MRLFNVAAVDAVTTVSIILSAVALLAAFKYLRQAWVLRGFSGLEAEVRNIRKLLDGKIVRNGRDVLIRGTFRAMPALIRLSRSENAPELTIQLRSRTRGNLFVAPLRAPTKAGELYVSTPHPLLASRCSVRTDYPSEARNLLQHPHVLEELWDLCCSSQAFISIGDGVIHFTDGQLPASGAAFTINRHLRSMCALALASQEKPQFRSKDRAKTRRATPVAALVAAVLLIAAGVFTAARRNRPKHAPAPAATPAVIAGIPRADARKLFGVGAWRLAKTSDFDPRAVAWLQGKGVEVSGAIDGVFGPAARPGVTYILVDSQTNSKRVVLLVDGAVKFDKVFSQLALVTKLVNVATAGAQWQGNSVIGEGDGVLIVPDFNDPQSATVISSSGVLVASATPKDFLLLHLQ
jgi:hypothetical protein